MTDAFAPDQSHWSRPLAERQIAILGELAEAGLEIALAIRDRIKAGPSDATANLPAAYARAARAVRLSLMLQDKLIQALLRSEVETAAAIDPPAVHARKVRIQNIVGRMGDCARRDRDRLDRMTNERLDHDVCGDLLSRPVSEIVAIICKDLSLSPNWSALAQETWAQEEIASGMIGRPLAPFAKAADRARTLGSGAPRSPKKLQ